MFAVTLMYYWLFVCKAKYPLHYIIQYMKRRNAFNNLDMIIFVILLTPKFKTGYQRIRLR